MILAITILGGLLRWHNYAQFPSQLETADEKAWTWLGTSLIKDRTPRSWSMFPAYEAEHVYQSRDNSNPIVSPALDHPPLFGLIPGAAHVATGANTFDIPSKAAIRAPMVLLGTINVLLFSILAFRLGSFGGATTASLLFATSPLVVASSRLVVADNLLATIVLALLLTIQVQPRQKLYQLLIGLLCCLAVLVKIQGIFIPFGLALFYISVPDKRSFLVVSAASLLGLLLFAAYGAYYDWSLFLEITFAQSQRVSGFTTLFHRFFHHASMAKSLWPTMTKGFLLSAALVSYAIKPKSRLWQLCGSVLIAYLIVALAAFDRTNLNGWYEYAIYPLLFLSLLPLIEWVLGHTSRLAQASIWLIFSLPLVQMLAINLGSLDPFSSHFKQLAPLVGGVAYLPLSANATKLLLICNFVALIALQAAVSWTMNEQSYAHQVFMLTFY